MDFLLNGDFSFLEQIGTDPFSAMWWLFLHGGWLLVVYLVGWGALELWVENRQHHFNSKKQWMVLQISVPRVTEQTPRAVENMFAHWAGAHGPNSWTENWIIGRTQDTISIEIASIEGRVQFYVHTTRGFRDLIEASVYAQYPDAEVIEVEDYTKLIPHSYPDKEWDVFCTEMIPVKPGCYPLRTYVDFEDRVSGEFKDPLAVLLENLSRLGPGEMAWYQIVLTPFEQTKFRQEGEMLVKKMSGQKVESKKSSLEKVLDIPFSILGEFLKILGLGAEKKAEEKKSPFEGKMMNITPGERATLEAVERKISKIVYKAKIRFVFAARKEIMKKSRMVHPFIGAMKQMNTNDAQSIRPESKKVGNNSTLWFFKDRRNNERKTRFIRAYSKRSNWYGTPNWWLNIEELATMWHFPHSMQVKAPQLMKTEAKRAEPPANLPFG